MESAAVLRSFSYSVGTVSHLRPALERRGMVPMHNATRPSSSSKSPIQGLTFGWELVSTPAKRAGSIVSCAKTSGTALIAKSDGSLEKNSIRGATFPSGIEELVLEVCDETQIAELKLKAGDFELHLKRNIGAAEAPVTIASPAPPPPIPIQPLTDSTPAALSSLPKSSSGKNNPFANVPAQQSRKLTALEASGASGYVLVLSPMVGTFRRGRTVKGVKKPPAINEGDLIQEGQNICYIDQFNSQLPVKSDADGEVIKILFEEGEGVGYGDPIIAVMPSFHGIK